MRKLYRAAVLFTAMCLFTTQLASAAPQKEETVYANLNYDGSIKGVYVVNSFKLSGEKRLSDFGSYTNIKNLSSSAEPRVTNGLVEWD